MAKRKGRRKRKKKVGFAAMSKAKRRKIAIMGGKASGRKKGRRKRRKR